MMSGRHNAADPAVLVDRFATLAREASGADTAAVFLLDSEAGTLFCQAVSVADDLTLRTPEVPEAVTQGEPELGAVVAFREAGVVPDLSVLPDSWVRSLRLQQAVVAPLSAGNSYLGLIVAGWATPDTPSGTAVAAAGNAGKSLALALEAVVADHVQLVLADEREQLSDELLGAVSRVLAAINLRSGLLRLVADDELADDVRAVESLARRGLAGIDRGRAQIHGLRHERPDLTTRVQQIAEAFESRQPARVLVDVRGGSTLPDDLQVALARVAQEAVSNVERHAQATLVTISLSVERDAAVLRIRDDGLGPIDAGEPAGDMGVGLTLVRQALEPVGGSAELRDAHPGAELIARVPLRRAPIPDPVPAH